MPPNRNETNFFPERKDVVYKKILRAFKKYISGLFKANVKKPCRVKDSIPEMKKSLVKEAVDLGIILPEE